MPIYPYRDVDMHGVPVYHSLKLPPPLPPAIGHIQQNRGGVKYLEDFRVMYGINVVGTQMLDVSLLGVGTPPCLERTPYGIGIGW